MSRGSDHTAIGAGLALVTQGLSLPLSYANRRKKKQKRRENRRSADLDRRDAERQQLVETLFNEAKAMQDKASKDAQFGLLARRASERRNKLLADAVFNDYGMYGQGIRTDYYLPSSGEGLKDILE